VLGLGFGMGWGKFSTELLKGMLGAKPVQFKEADAAKFGVDAAEFERHPFGLPEGGVTCGDKVQDLITFGARLPYAPLLIHCAVTAYFVGLYRASNPRIKGLWDAARHWIGIMAEPGEDRAKVRLRFGPIEVMRHALRKPNGTVMHYPGLRKSGDGYVYQGGKSGREVTRIYGGLVVENCVQSLARDIVAEQALWVRSRGYRIGTTTHDEIVSVVPEVQGETALANMLRIMRTPPSWCADLPLNAAGGYAKSYGAVK
jgi:DNA polymerase